MVGTALVVKKTSQAVANWKPTVSFRTLDLIMNGFERTCRTFGITVEKFRPVRFHFEMLKHVINETGPYTVFSNDQSKDKMFELHKAELIQAIWDLLKTKTHDDPLLPPAE